MSKFTTYTFGEAIEAVKRVLRFLDLAGMEKSSGWRWANVLVMQTPKANS